jgi:DHA1 family bicyclomycin/chloramphenicol resistance-like MFS transporter
MTSETRVRPKKVGTRLPQAGLWFAVSFALVTILGPSGTDMYLASLPEVVTELGSTTSHG